MQTHFRGALIGFVLIVSPAVLSAAQTINLFNGKDLKGWTKRGGDATYTVDNGEIVGHSAPNTTNTFLCTDKEFGDFLLELDFKIDPTNFNSGVQLRSHSRPEGEQQRVYGYQVEIDTLANRPWTGGIYFEGGSKDEKGDWIRKGGWLYDLRKTKPPKNSATWANGITLRSWPRVTAFKPGSTASRPLTLPRRMKRHFRQRASSRYRCTPLENRRTQRKCASKHQADAARLSLRASPARTSGMMLSPYASLERLVCICRFNQGVGRGFGSGRGGCDGLAGVGPWFRRRNIHRFVPAHRVDRAPARLSVAAVRSASVALRPGLPPESRGRGPAPVSAPTSHSIPVSDRRSSYLDSPKKKDAANSSL